MAKVWVTRGTSRRDADETAGREECKGGQGSQCP
eukprot:CAMPEP_0194063850 /NCGR_PEP_ID=MMETSP0009_2-20130614/81424_1 /TAXON_ID=210454 /ORGANISM="Grammatophora oceanica, Strain CCMP 410" /LENGTH=33 /DNA_ID= /DNA_START= /DNA_END= /DNA_ORIENTATION=